MIYIPMSDPRISTATHALQVAEETGLPGGASWLITVERRPSASGPVAWGGFHGHEKG